MPTESPFQTIVTHELLNTQAGGFVVGLTENELAVLVTATATDTEAAFTAAQARTLADAIEAETGEHLFSERFTALAAYIRDLAAVVDNDREYAAVQAQYDDHHLLCDPSDLNSDDAPTAEPLSVQELAELENTDPDA